MLGRASWAAGHRGSLITGAGYLFLACWAGPAGPLVILITGAGYLFLACRAGPAPAPAAATPGSASTQTSDDTCDAASAEGAGPTNTQTQLYWRRNTQTYIYWHMDVTQTYLTGIQTSLLACKHTNVPYCHTNIFTGMQTHKQL